MFNFDFQKTEIYRAVKVAKNPIFRAIKIKKIILLALSIIFGLLFLVSTFGSQLNNLFRDKSLINIAFDYNMYFNEDVDRDGKEANIENGSEIAVGVEYALNQSLTLSGGYLISPVVQKKPISQLLVIA